MCIAAVDPPRVLHFSALVQNVLVAVACSYFRGFFNIVLAKNMIAGVTSLHTASICVKVKIGEVEL